MPKEFSDGLIKEALKNGHGNWKVLVPGYEEEFYLRLEKENLNSENYVMVFSTEERNAWDVSKGKNAYEILKGLKGYFPKGISFLDAE